MEDVFIEEEVVVRFKLRLSADLLSFKWKGDDDDIFIIYIWCRGTNF